MQTERLYKKDGKAATEGTEYRRPTPNTIKKMPTDRPPTRTAFGKSPTSPALSPRISPSDVVRNLAVAPRSPFPTPRHAQKTQQAQVCPDRSRPVPANGRRCATEAAHLCPLPPCRKAVRRTGKQKQRAGESALGDLCLYLRQQPALPARHRERAGPTTKKTHSWDAF